MSDTENRRDLYDDFFKSADPPSSPGRNVLPGRVPWGKTSADYNLREVVLKEYAERYEKHGISDLLSLRDHLREVHSELHNRAETAWDEFQRVDNKITIEVQDETEIRREPDPSAKEEDWNRHEEYLNKAADLYSKSKIVQYRLTILEKYIWENSIRGKWLRESSVRVSGKSDGKGEESDLTLKRKATICAFAKARNPRKFVSKKEFFEAVVKSNFGSVIGDTNVSPESLKRYIRKNTKAAGKNINELADLIEEWEEDEEVKPYLAILTRDEATE